ncbi:ABC transporter permease [Verrucomicrobiota bacterium sgz303538]
MTQLILKELRALRPYVWLVLGTAVLGAGYELTSSFPDQRPLETARLLKELGDVTLILLFGLMLGAGILIRESEDGTLSFLDGLPVSRTRIFVAKALAGFCVLLLLPVTSLAFELLTGLMSQTSVSPPAPWRFLAAIGGLSAFVTIYVLGAALALSFFRQWLALVSGLIVWVFAWLSAHGETWQKFLNPLALFSGLGAPGSPIPWRYVLFQSGATLIAFIVAWICFCHMGGRAQDSMDRIRSNRSGRLLLGCARLFVPVVWFLAISTATRDSDPDKKNKDRPLGEAVFARRETEYFEFLFREGQRELSKELMDAADGVFATLSSEFEIEPRKERIIVDLASPVTPHAAAVTNWTKIRLPIFGATPLAELKLFLGHETAHVLANQLGGAGFEVSAHRYTRFFNEGLATYYEDLFLEGEDPNGMRRLAAAVASRGKVPFETLSDNEALERVRDPELVYPLGSAFCRALVEVGGDDAPARVLREFGRSGHGYRLSGVSLWRVVLQNCGLSLEEVTAAYDAEIEKLLHDEAEFVARIPVLSAKVDLGGDEIVLTPQETDKPPGTVVCGVETSTFFGNLPKWYKSGADGKIHIPRTDVTGASFRYLIGWRIEGLRLPVFEPWTESPL